MRAAVSSCASGRAAAAGGRDTGGTGEWDPSPSRNVAYRLVELTTDGRERPAYRLTSSYQGRASAAAAEELEKAVPAAMVRIQPLSRDRADVEGTGVGGDRLACRHRRTHPSRMFAVDELTTQAICDALEQGGELSAVAELRRRFPLITDNAEARRCVRIIAGWTPLSPTRPLRRRQPKERRQP